ncbi:hypothetical protein Ahu01nite_075580 [Winogradskya humida]|uniref:Uncharacterized protein n=1 Tax=Winogradskya humida TaxID=113566 RepID=A0ABQ4A0S3_9ACTN|nr:hypothetical protein Ahu01nite_075580 [Actinoplanes humidus]
MRRGKPGALGRLPPHRALSPGHDRAIAAPASVTTRGPARPTSHHQRLGFDLRPAIDDDTTIFDFWVSLPKDNGPFFVEARLMTETGSPLVFNKTISFTEILTVGFAIFDHSVGIFRETRGL